MLTAERVKQLLDYDPATGSFTWRENRGGTARRGGRAGSINVLGYVDIGVSGRRCLGHRLAWLYVHGAWPPHEIDHINGNPADNRIANLRLATRTQNVRNTRRRHDNSSGVKGVYWIARCGKWRADIRVAGKGKHLGYFNRIEDAAAAYERAAAKHFGEFARTA